MVQVPTDKAILREFFNYVGRLESNKTLTAEAALQLGVAEARRLAHVQDAYPLSLLKMMLANYWMRAWSQDHDEPQNSPRRRSVLRVLSPKECEAVGHYCSQLFVENVTASTPFELVRVQAGIRMAEYAHLSGDSAFARSLLLATEDRWFELICAQPDESPTTEWVFHELRTMHLALASDLEWTGDEVRSRVRQLNRMAYDYHASFGPLKLPPFPVSWPRNDHS
jgi:hypothetical protein